MRRARFRSTGVLASAGWLGVLSTCGCAYDFDGAFAEPPLFTGSDGSTDVVADADASDGKSEADGTGGEAGLDSCWPSCLGKCSGADNGCGQPCAEDDCGGVCCGAECCGAGAICTGNQCCAAGTCNSLDLECGVHDDGCGGTISCGTCSQGPCDSEGQCTGCTYGACSGTCCGNGQVCDQNGACCTPTTCGALGVACGVHDDGCGNALACGTCSQDSYCLNGVYCTALNFQFQQVQGGTFSMGSPTTEPGRDEYTGGTGNLDETLHQVTLTHAFEISNSELVRADFIDVMGYDPSYFEQCGNSCPVEYLTWDEAAQFCNKLSEVKQLQPCFACSGSGSSVSCALSPNFASPYDCQGYRLPTEAEWEYAARGGTQTAFSSGSLQNQSCAVVDNNLSQIGWYLANGSTTYSGSLTADCEGTPVSIGTHPVAVRSMNAFGLYDMAGNVWEWVFECGDSYPSTPQLDPVGPLSCNNQYRVYRGGGAGNTAVYCRHAERADYTPSSAKNIDIGFRPARTAW